MRFQSERLLSPLVEGGTAEYPPFTGSEPCASIGVDWYCREDMESSHHEILRGACATCPLIKECFNWALQNERYYYWAGSTPMDRDRLRKKLDIQVSRRFYS